MNRNQSPVMMASSPSSTAPPATAASSVSGGAADEGSVMDEFDLRLREESESIPSSNRRSFPPIRLPIRLGASPQQAFAAPLLQPLPLPTAAAAAAPPHHNRVASTLSASQQQQQQHVGAALHGQQHLNSNYHSPMTSTMPAAQLPPLPTTALPEDDDMWALIAQSVAKHSGVKTPTTSTEMEELLEVFMRELVRPSSATLPSNPSPRQGGTVAPPQDGRATIVAELQWAANREVVALPGGGSAQHATDAGLAASQVAHRPGQPLDAAAVIAAAAAAASSHPSNAMSTPRTTLTPRNNAVAAAAYHHYNKYSSPVLGVSSSTHVVSSPRPAATATAAAMATTTTAGCPRPRASKVNRIHNGSGLSTTAAPSTRNASNSTITAAAAVAAAQRSSAVLRSRGKHITKSASSAFSECSTSGSTADISSEQSHQTKGTAMSY